MQDILSIPLPHISNLRAHMHAHVLSNLSLSFLSFSLSLSLSHTPITTPVPPPLSLSLFLDCVQDCSTDDRQVFRSCIQSQVGGLSRSEQSEHSCSSRDSAQWSDWESLVCVAVDNNPSLGLYYDRPQTVSTETTYDTLRSRHKETVTSFQAKPRTESTSQLSIGYRHGDVIRTVPSGGSSSQNGQFSLPEGGDICAENVPVRFLVDRKSECVLEMTSSSCAVTSLFSSWSYILPDELSSTNCPSTNFKLVSGNSTVPVCSVVYFCRRTVPFVNNRTGLATLNQTSPPTTSQDVLCDTSDLNVPPTPSQDTVNNFCHNSVVAVSYHIFWRGEQIVGLSANVTLASVRIGNGSISSFIVLSASHHFIHRPASQGGGCPSSDWAVPATRSGNPGYVQGRPLLSGRLGLSADNSSQLTYATHDRLHTWRPVGRSLCSSSDAEEITFGVDKQSGCVLQINLQQIRENCDAIRSAVKELQESLVGATHVARFGNASNTWTVADWVQVLRCVKRVNCNCHYVARLKVARDCCDVIHSLTQASIHTSQVHGSKSCTKYSLHLMQSTSRHICHNVVRSKVLIVHSRSILMQDTA